MSKINKLSILILMAVLLVPRGAQADPIPWIWDWQWCALFDTCKDPVAPPYLEDAKHTQNTQWDRSRWKPADWEGQRVSPNALIKRFYRADVLRGQEVRHGMPVVVVGPNFYNLGGEEKRQLARTIDDLWHVTSSQPGMYLLYDDITGASVGVYTKDGLQLQ